MLLRFTTFVGPFATLAVAVLALAPAAQVPTAPAGQFADFLPKAAAEIRPIRGGAVATRAAVLVAADRYANLASEERELPSAQNTMTRLGEGLVLHAGFAPTAVASLAGKDVTAQLVKQTILDAARRLQPSDDGLLLLCWAGHGWVHYVDKGGAKVAEQYLLSYVSQEQGTVFSDGILLSDLVAWLSAARDDAQRRGVLLKPVVVVDACRVSRGAPPPKVKPVPLAAWQVFGASEGQMVQAGHGGESFLFLGTLLEQMAGFAKHGKSAPLDVVFAAAQRATQARSPQVPEFLLPSDAVLGRAGAPALVVPRRVSLQVRCVDALTGVPVERVAIAVNDEAAVLASAGELRRLLAPSRTVLATRAEGYLGRTDELDLKSVDLGAEVVLPLLPYVAVVRGRLVPPATATLRVSGGAARAQFHVVEQTTGREGRFELRVPALAGSELRVVQQGRVLQRFALPAQPSTFLRDRDGRHDGVPLVELVAELDEAALRELGADAPPAPVDIELSDPDDRADWEQAQQAIAKKRWDLARTRLAGIASPGRPGDRERVAALARQVETRWAVAQLEQVLAAGKADGDWARSKPLLAWWASQPAVDDAARIAALFAEIERESIALPVRRAVEAGNQAYADGRLEQALAEYERALAGANDHYRTQLEAQRADIKRTLYRRLVNVAFAAELDGDTHKALDAYGKALDHSDRARRDVERLLEDQQLAASARGQELRKRLVSMPAPSVGAVARRLPADWRCEVLDATPGGKTGYPKKVRDQTSGIVLLLVEPGEFQMGGDGGAAGEQPVHRVRINKPFYLAETEVTVAQWRAFATATDYRSEAERGAGGWTLTLSGDGWERVKEATWRRPFPTSRDAPRDDHPVVQVSWHDAQAFVRWLNGGAARPFRLPSEAEFEFAARAGTTTAYWWGDAPRDGHDKGNFADRAHLRASPKDPDQAFDFADGYPMLAPVGSFAANPWGFKDLLGNVAEWCEDWYGEGYYATCGSAVDDPAGPTSGTARVLRGASWDTGPRFARVACRASDEPATAIGLVGFRVARSL